MYVTGFSAILFNLIHWECGAGTIMFTWLDFDRSGCRFANIRTSLKAVLADWLGALKRGLCLIYVAALGSTISPNSVSQLPFFFIQESWPLDRESVCSGILWSSCYTVCASAGHTWPSGLYMIFLFKFCFVPSSNRFAVRDAFFVGHLHK